MNYIARHVQPSIDSKGPAFGPPPVLVVLHGYGTDERDMLPLAERVGAGYLIISLQGPIELSHDGHAWYHLLQTPDGIVPDDSSRHQSEEQIISALPGIIAREGGDAERVVFMGFSQGAAVIYSLLAIYDLRNYGITPIASINLSGYLPRDIFEALSEKDLKGFPFFLSLGEFDELIAPQALSEAQEYLTKQGALVTANMYAVGHGVLPETTEAITQWLSELSIM